MNDHAFDPAETLGQRIARLRAGRAWTQQDLAERLAASRVAVSHFEMGLATPSERTVVLLAGLFGMEPDDLVDGTNYPAAKAERLPTSVCRYTELEFQLALLRRDLEWAVRLGPSELARTTLAAISERLDALDSDVYSPYERALIEAVRKQARLAAAGDPGLRL